MFTERMFEEAKCTYGPGTFYCIVRLMINNWWQKITDLVMFNPACLTSFQVEKYLGLFQLGNTYWILPDRSSPVSLSLHLSLQTDILMLSTGHAETRVVLFLKRNTACLSTSRWRRQRRVVAFILKSEWRITTRCVDRGERDGVKGHTC